MNIMDAIRKRILKFLKIDKLTYNPESDKFNFINDEQDIIKANLDEAKVWYTGDSNQLLNYYTTEDASGFAKEAIYNRNRQYYFWALSAKEAKIKRVHSGIPKSIVDTLVNVIGDAQIDIKQNGLSQDNAVNELLDKIIEKNDMTHLLNQQQIPLTLVEGWGAFKVNFDKDLSNYPIIQYYEAEDVDFAYKGGMLVGIIYKDYYKVKDKKYVMLETRRVIKEKDDSGETHTKSVIEYELFRLNKNDVTPADFDEVPELAGIENVEIPNFNKILGVPSKFFYDPENKNYGKSIYAGKIDLFDALDENLSQSSRTTRLSTPVEYIPVDLLERQADGVTKLPDSYDRQFIAKESVPNGDGETRGEIQTTQPNLNSEMYHSNTKALLDMILTGILSPATLGIDVAKKDNADAQREKEKVTIMTRNNIIDRETNILKDLYTLCLCVEEYMVRGSITKTDYDITVKFDEFANPSFENELQVLQPAWSAGGISTEKYVDLLWGDSLSDEDKANEIAKLEENRQQDNLELGDFGNADSSQFYSGSEEPKTEQTEETKEQLY